MLSQDIGRRQEGFKAGSGGGTANMAEAAGGDRPAPALRHRASPL